MGAARAARHRCGWYNIDLLMLRKAYAAVLLKLRGQPMPLLAELDA